MLLLQKLSGCPVSVAFSPDGAWLVAGLTDATARTWDVHAGEPVGVVRCRVIGIPWVDRVTATFTPDGRQLLVSDNRGGLAVHEPTGERVRALVKPTGVIDIRAVASGPDGRVFVGVRGVTAFDPAAGWSAAVVFPGRGAVGALAAEPGGPRLATGIGLLLDLAAGRTLPPWLGREDANPHALAWAAGRPLLAGTTGGPVVRVYDMDAAEQVEELRPSPKHTNAVAFTPDGRHLLTAGNDGLVHVIDADTWAERRAFDWNLGPVHALAVSPDGTRAAAGAGVSRRGKVVVWDLE